MVRIRLLSRILRIIFLIIIILTPIINALVWIYFEKLDMVDLAHFYPSIPMDGLTIKSPITSDTKVLGFMVSMIPEGIHMVAFYLLFMLFGLYAQGKIFTQDAVSYIRKAGYTLLAGQIIGPMHDALITYVLTMHNPAGMHSISIGFGSTDISEIIIAGLVILVSWVMDEGRKLKEEEALVI